MDPLYNFGIRCFAGAARLAALRSSKVRCMLAGQRRTLETLAAERARVAPDGYDVWFHAASLGEFEQGRPLIERLRRERPELKILLTFFSPSGYEVRRGYNQVDTVAYLPFDTPHRVHRFLDAASPHMAIFIKYEFWGNYLSQLRARNIPVYIISAIFRPTQRFFRAGSGMWRRMLRCFTHIYVQDESSRSLLAGIGVNNVTVAGDTRFDRVTDIMRGNRTLAAVERFAAGSPFTLVAGSSWSPDEDCFVPWLHSHREVRAIVAPHQFDRTRLDLLLARLGSGAMLMSDFLHDDAAGTLAADPHYLVVDYFGLLSSLYRYASAAYIGGGFGAGIHNLNEAAVYAIPVIFGPNHHKFKEASDLIACGGGICIDGAATCAAALDKLVSSPDVVRAAGKKAGEYVCRNLGATNTIFNDIFGRE